MAWLFKHEYSPAGLSFAGLKGEDTALAKVLRRAAESAGCAVHLGIVHIEETGPAEPDYSDYRGRRRSYDDEDDAADEDADFEVVEVSDGSCHIGEWHDTDDHPVDFGNLPLEEGEVLPAGALDGEKPDEQRVMEATGNEGATFERSYHRAALVMWPRDRFADVLMQAGVGAVMPYLAEQVAASGSAVGTAAQRKAVIGLARRVIKQWETGGSNASYSAPDKKANRSEMIDLLVRLGDTGLLERFIKGVVTHRFDGSENESLAAAAIFLSPETFDTFCTALVRENVKRFPCAVIELVGGVIRVVGNALDAHWKKALKPAAEVIVATLPELKPAQGSPASTGSPYQHLRYYDALMRAEAEDSKDDELDSIFDDDDDEGPITGYGSGWRPAESRAIGAAQVAELLGSLRALGTDKLRAEATAAIVANEAVFDPVKVIVPALAALQTSARGANSEDADDAERTRLWHHAAEFLLARSEQPPVPPTDWKQDATIPGKTPDDRELEAFARDPMAREHRFRVATDRRAHLHRTIEKLDLDMTHVTERVGRPYTLVCRKTMRTYERQCAQHETDTAAMHTLLDLQSYVAPNAKELASRLTSATERKPVACTAPTGVQK